MQRNSAIELLKIVAMLLIVLSHVTQTLCVSNEFIANQDYVIDLKLATTDLYTLILVFFRHLGIIGISIFFVSSAWFLLDNDEVKPIKIISMILLVWFTSVAILIPILVIRRGDVPIKILIAQFLPTTYSTNWYITCYIIFYSIHSCLNMIIRGMTRQDLLKNTIILSFMYIFVNFILGDAFMASALTLWITVYFIMAYLKLYVPKFVNNVHFNIKIVTISIVLLVALVLITNILGLYFPFLANKNLHWNKISNPFAIILAISLFFICSNEKYSFRNVFVNYVSSLTIYIYIIHENFLIRRMYRPLVWLYLHGKIMENGGDKYLYVVFDIVYAVILFVLSILIGAVFKKIFKGMIKSLSIIFNDFLNRCFNKIDFWLSL